MTALAWDAVGERRFETGVDRGVLYLPDDGAVPWNGLVSVTENLGREVKSYYTDGIKYLDHQVIDAYSADLQAFTYPDELDALVGLETFAPGVFIHDQRSRAFSLCYRTLVGNDVESTDFGYKIHIIYNVTATPGNAQSQTLGRELTAPLLSWSLKAVPPVALGIRPTSHISLHTRSLDPDLLSDIEDLLYGTALLDPSLPDLVDLLGMVEEFYAT